jgi:hypothetical protein
MTNESKTMAATNVRIRIAECSVRCFTGIALSHGW